MRKVLIRNLNKPEAQPLIAIYCASFICRLRGLTFSSHLSPQEGLLLVQGQESRAYAAIHMLGVWITLAVAWINSAGFVVDVCLAKPWRLGYIPREPARFVLEMAAERIRDFRVGDHVLFEEVPVD